MNTLHSLFHWTLDASLRASLLAGAVLCLQTALRGRISARWRYAMWLPVLFVLVAPVLPESRWSAEQWFKPKAVAVTLVSDPVAETMPLVPAPMIETSASVSASLPLSPAPVSIDWQLVMACSWAAGVALVITGGLGLYLTEMRRCRRSAVPVSPTLRAWMQGTAHDLKLRRVPEVWMSSRITSPAVAGLWRPVVLLPADFESAFTEAEAALVLRHELMHLKRRDLHLNALLSVLQALHWFNPLLWFVAARVRQDREAACDSQVLASTANDCRRDYGLALLKVQTTCQPHGFCLGLVGMFGDHASVKMRIAAIARYERAHPLKGLLAAAAILGLGVLGATRAEAPSFQIGASDFTKGDAIHITSVNRSDTLIAVSGDYELASQDEATLAFYITATDKEHAKSMPDPQQRMSVKKGKGTFTLVHPHPHAGLPHVSFYPSKGGKVIGGIYFGTTEEAEASKLLSQGNAKPTQTAVGTNKTAAEMSKRFAAYKALLDEVQRLEKESQDPVLSAEARAKAAAAFKAKLKEARDLEAEMKAFQQQHSAELKKAGVSLEVKPTQASRPVASVGGQFILGLELEEVLAAQRQVIRLRHRDNPTEMASELAKLDQTALDQLIDRQLILAEFKKMGGTIKPEYIDEDINKLIQGQFKGDREAFSVEMAKQGITMKKFREMREKMIIVQVMRSKMGGKQEPPTADEVKHYYDDHQAKWRTGDKLKVSTITLPKFKDHSTPGKQKQLAEDIHAKIKGGADFATIAKAHSQDTRAQHGGAWEEMEAKMLSPVMREAATNTKVGDVTAVIEDTSAFIILRVDEKKLGTVPPLDTVRSEIEKTIKAERSAVAVEKWLAGLRAKASIKRFE